MLKNVKALFKSILSAAMLLSFIALTSCGGGGGGSSVTPDYTNTNLPLADTQDWLIMYYCDADNDLEEFIMNDLNEMESVDLSTKKIKIVALVDRNASYYTGDGNWSDSRVYEIKYDSAGYNSTLVSERLSVESLGIAKNTSHEVNMGDGDTLTQFIEFCNTNYPATKKMLLFTNHGGGWRNNPVAKKTRLEKIGLTKAVCWDETNSDDCLYTSEVRTAISTAIGTTKLDVIAFDACLMAMVEVAYEMKDIANYMVASEETIPGYGFPFTQIMTALPADLNAYTSIQFGQNIIDEYYDAYINGTNVEEIDFTDDTATLSLIDLSKVTPLATAINSFGSALNTANGSNANMDKRIISETFEITDYVDIRDYCSNETLCTTERNAVITAFDAAVIYNKAGDGNVNAKGLSAFMPLIWTAEGEQPDYTSSNLQFINDFSGWRTYITKLTATTATDQPEITESAYGGAIPIDVPSLGIKTISKAYIYYGDDVDTYVVTSSDGYIRIRYSGYTSNVYVDAYTVSKSTDEPIDYQYVDDVGYHMDITYNPATSYVLVFVSGQSSESNWYNLEFQDID